MTGLLPISPLPPPSLFSRHASARTTEARSLPWELTGEPAPDQEPTPSEVVL
jgi:hypothetical protein